MCGRYTMSTAAEALEARFHAVLPAHVYEATYNAAPSQEHLTVLSDNPHEIACASSGYLPAALNMFRSAYWRAGAKNPKVKDIPRRRVLHDAICIASRLAAAVESTGVLGALSSQAHGASNSTALSGAAIVALRAREASIKSSSDPSAEYSQFISALV